MSYRVSALRRVLVATNLDAASDAAIDAAASIAAPIGAEVVLLCVLEALMYTPPSMAAFAAKDPTTHAEATRRLTAQVERSRSRGVATASGKIEFGIAADHIVQHANSGDYNLLVIGNRGNKGSIADFVLPRSKIPVLIAPPATTV